MIEVCDIMVTAIETTFRRPWLFVQCVVYWNVHSCAEAMCDQEKKISA